MKKTVVLSLIAFLAFAGAAMCADNKMVVVDMSRILKNHPDAMKAKDRLDGQLKEYEGERSQLMSELTKKKDAFEEARKAAESKALSDEQRAKMQDDAEQKFRDLKEFDVKMRKTLEAREKDLQDEDGRVSKRILADIREMIGEFSKKKGYTLVLDSSSISLTRIGTVIYADPVIDITDDILKLIPAPKEKK